jgi:hypothetical protein
LRSLKDTVFVVDSLVKLWEVGCINKELLKKVFSTFETVMDKNSPEMRSDYTGKQFASILRLMKFAQSNQIFRFQDRGFDRCQEIFLSSDYTNYSVSDLCQILESMTFESFKAFN